VTVFPTFLGWNPEMSVVALTSIEPTQKETRTRGFLSPIIRSAKGRAAVLQQLLGTADLAPRGRIDLPCDG